MAQNVYGSVLPLHLLSKLFGFSLFSVDRKSFKVKITLLDVLFMVLHLIIVVLFEISFRTSYIQMNIKSSVIIRNFFPSVAYVGFVIFTCAKVWSFTQRHKFARFLKTLHEIDVELEELGFSVDHKSQLRFVIKLIVLANVGQTTIIALCCVVQKYANMKISGNIYVFVSFGNVACYLVMSQFIASVTIVKERFRTLKEVARFERQFKQQVI